MELKVQFDGSLLSEYEKRGSSKLFGIWWTFGRTAYPEEGWLDFGAVILGWWIVALMKLLAGEPRVELLFMDGPFALSVQRQPNGKEVLVTTKDGEASGIYRYSDLAQAVLRAANATCREFLAANVAVAERAALEADMHALKRAMLASAASDNPQ